MFVKKRIRRNKTNDDGFGNCLMTTTTIANEKSFALLFCIFGPLNIKKNTWQILQVNVFSNSRFYLQFEPIQAKDVCVCLEKKKSIKVFRLSSFFSYFSLFISILILMKIIRF